jgi:hypothetical protein
LPQKSRATNSYLRQRQPPEIAIRLVCSRDNCFRATQSEYNSFQAILFLGEAMYHYDARIALEELQEDALLPHPVKLRDMILRTKLGAQDAQLLNHDFQDYLARFGELQKTARGILEKLAAGQRKAS